MLDGTPGGLGSGPGFLGQHEPQTDVDSKLTFLAKKAVAITWRK